MKDPSFPFYAQDFTVGTMHFSMAERGLYITLLAYQWVNGKIPKERLGIILGYDWDKYWVTVGEKFKEVEPGFLINERLEAERDKRARFKEKQSENGVKGGRPAKIKPKDNPTINPNETQTITQTQTQRESQKKPLENENEYEYEKEKDNEYEKEGSGEKTKIDFEAIVKIFNAVCHKLPAVSKLTPQRKTSLKNRVDEVGLNGLGDVFQKVADSTFLNGENGRGWTADFDWIIKPANFIKISEGHYKNKHHGTGTKSTGESKYQVSDDLKRKIAERIQPNGMHEAR